MVILNWSIAVALEYGKNRSNSCFKIRFLTLTLSTPHDHNIRMLNSLVVFYVRFDFHCYRLWWDSIWNPALLNQKFACIRAFFNSIQRHVSYSRSQTYCRQNKNEHSNTNSRVHELISVQGMIEPLNSYVVEKRTMSPNWNLR